MSQEEQEHVKTEKIVKERIETGMIAKTLSEFEINDSLLRWEYSIPFKIDQAAGMHQKYSICREEM